MNRTTARKPARKSVGVRELKTHAAGIVRQVRDSRASYLVTHRGQAVAVILPIDDQDGTSEASESVDSAAAWETFMRAGRRLERRFAPGVSGVRLPSGMRR
jgi:prevent-host-death family protein